MPDGGGIFVQVCFAQNAWGASEAAISQPATQQETSTPPQEKAPAQEKLITQKEPSIKVDQQTIEEQKRKEEEREKQRKEEERQKKVAIETENLVSSLFNASNQNRGETSGEGVEGSRQGNASTGESSGIGGYGDVRLGGRGLVGTLPKPTYDQSNDEGTIVVNIKVDSKGIVTEAKATLSGSKGTAFHNLTLRKAAEDAAKLTRFVPSNDPNQKQGTITYYFKTTN